MGWSRGGEIFAPVLRSLYASHASAYVMRQVLTALHEALHECDWDTCDEVLQDHPDDLIVRVVFAQAGCLPEEEENT